MKMSIFRRILHKIGQIIQSIGNWIGSHKQNIVYALLIMSASIYFIYTLGYSSNWAMIVSETRATNFYRASQQVNRLIAQLGFILVVISLFTLAFGSLTRKKFYLSNIVLSILASLLLIFSSIITFYYNSVLRVMYANITEVEVPAYLYATHGAGKKSFMVFDLGYFVTGFMMIVAIMLIVFLTRKLIAQKQRVKLIEKLVNANEH